MRRVVESAALTDRGVDDRLIPVRRVALCILWRGRSILVGRGYDATKEQSFFRPLGGGIEAGETPAAAIVREIREEIGREARLTGRIGVLESRFIYEGQPRREVAEIFEAELVGPPPALVVTDEGWTPTWIDLDNLASDCPLYPLGLVELLGSRYGGRASLND
jgi:8-oxo-dGTP pyrophosphatase MutT (NUDIX family)